MTKIKLFKLKKKILIIGSNFALNYHFKIINRLYSKCEINIVSPNLDNKKLNKNIIQHKDLNKVLKEKKFYLILCCATPIVQTKFIKYIYINKIKSKKILLEKPVSLDLKILKKFFTYSKKNNINVAVNYTYSNLKIVNKIKNFIKNTSNNLHLNFSLKFMHPFFIKQNKSWKNFISEGGGIINYYINHILFSFTKICGELKIKSLKVTTNNKNEIEKFTLNLLNKKIKINIFINLYSKNYIHEYKLYYKDIKKIFLTKRKNWYLKYEYYNNNKKKEIYKENILNLIKLNYGYLNIKNSEKSEYLNKIYINEILCQKINKKLMKYDFKKM